MKKNCQKNLLKLASHGIVFLIFVSLLVGLLIPDFAQAKIEGPFMDKDACQARENELRGIGAYTITEPCHKTGLWYHGYSVTPFTDENSCISSYRKITQDYITPAPCYESWALNYEEIATAGTLSVFAVPSTITKTETSSIRVVTPDKKTGVIINFRSKDGTFDKKQCTTSGDAGLCDVTFTPTKTGTVTVEAWAIGYSPKTVSIEVTEVGPAAEPGEVGPTVEPIRGIEKRLVNPLAADTFAEFIKAILDAVLLIGIPIVALAIIYSGFLFIEARGNEEKLKKAKKTFFWVIVGSLILLGSWLLAQAIGATIKQLGA